MSYTILLQLTRDAAPRRPRRASRGLGSWLLVLIAGLAEGYTARSQYHKLADEGLRPEAALRIAFELRGANETRIRSTAVSTDTKQVQ